jgi:hypothetical protein
MRCPESRRPNLQFKGINEMERSILLASALLVAAATAAAAGPDPFRPGNGITQLDLLGDGTPSMMVVGKRENFNAHSFDVISLYVRVDHQLEIVPFFDAGKEQDQLTSSGGADCLLHDFRFFRRKPRAPLELVVADRDYGDSFVDVRPVTFRRYALIRNVDSEPGAPTWSFQLRATRVSEKSYCDVGDAFEKERGWRG